MKYNYLLIFFLFLFLPSSYATHMVGGDITYKCLGNNQFEITITLYQDCLNGEPGAITQDNPAFYSIYTSGPNPIFVKNGSVFYTETKHIDPDFNNDCINNPPRTCMQEMVFVFVETLQPSSTGYTIVYQRCCRNAAINNIANPGNTGVTYTATIPPFENGECSNNSAVFKSLPPQIICINNPFIYDFSATDIDGDSLSYELCAAKKGGSPSNPKPSGTEMGAPPYPNLNYIPPYSATVPVPGFPPFAIDPQTGVLSGNPTSLGRYVVTVCVNEWRNGAIINTISRDVQFVITNCSKAVIADIPELPDAPNVYAIECKDLTVHFKNTSSGGFSYYWDFGVPGATSTEFEPSYTYPDTGVYKVKLVVNPGSTCSDSIYRYVKVYPTFHADFEWAGNLCPEETIQFTDLTTVTHGSITSWHWDLGDSTSSNLPNPTHQYDYPGGPQQVKLITTSSLGCIDSIEKTLPISVFDVFAGNDTIIVKDYPFSLNGSGAQYYSWTPTDYLSNPFIANPSVHFPDVGDYTYVLSGTNEFGCSKEDTIRIMVVDNGSIFVPNAFSPNGDGLNDALEVKSVGYALVRIFEIYNRYGQKVYYSANKMNPTWDGTFRGQPADPGVYYWILKAVNAFGELETLKGDFTLLR